MKPAGALLEDSRRKPIPMKPLLRPAGVLALLVGLLLTLFGFVAPALPAAALTDTTGLVCNNQKDRADQDCEGANLHGKVTATFDGSGNLSFDIDGLEGFGGWRQIYICIPGTAKSNRADCQGSTASVLDPRPKPGGSYDVELPTTNTEASKDVSFACTTNTETQADADNTFEAIDAIVYASALPASGTFNWTIHVNTCGGGTDEAFGTSTKPPKGEEPPTKTYNCVAASPVGQTTATLRGSTNDTSVTSALFTLKTPAVSSAGTDTTTDSGAFSVDVTGLAPNTTYTYDVEFRGGNPAATKGTASGCGLVTAAVPDTYECLAPTDVTATSAKLRGRTNDVEIDGATFALTPQGGTATAVSGIETGDTNAWTGSATSLQPSTSYTYTVQFLDDAKVEGTGTSADCTFTTAASSTGGTTTGGTTTGGTTTGGTTTEAVSGGAGAGGVTTGAIVAGVVVNRDASVPAAVAPSTSTRASSGTTAGVAVARTGLASSGLLPVGIGLVLLGFLALRMSGRRQPVLAYAPVRSSATPGPRAALRPAVVLAGILAVGAVLGRQQR